MIDHDIIPRRGDGDEEGTLFDTPTEYAQFWHDTFRGGFYEATETQEMPEGGWAVTLVNRSFDRSEDDETEVVVWVDPDEGHYYADDPDRKGYEAEIARIKDRIAAKAPPEVTLRFHSLADLLPPSGHTVIFRWITPTDDPGDAYWIAERWGNRVIQEGGFALSVSELIQDHVQWATLPPTLPIPRKEEE